MSGTGEAAVARRIRAQALQSLDFGRERLRSYVLAESPSGDPGALERCLELVEKGHRGVGGRTERVASATGDHLVTSWGDDSAPGHLLIVAHYDTVWPVGQLEQMPYADDGGMIAGPGTYDMKGGLVVLEMAMRALERAGVEIPGGVRAVTVADEEVGSPSGRAVVEAQLEGAVAVLGLESPHPDGALKSARLGSVRFRLRVRGRESHAALDPEGGVSAIDELLDQLAAIRELIPRDGSTLFNIGTIHGGTRTNVVAAEATAEIGIRFSSTESEAALLNTIEHFEPRRRGAVIDVEMLSLRPCWPSRPPGELLEQVARVGDLLGQRIEDRPAAGGADTNFAGSKGMATLDGFGPRGRGAHALDEAIVTASLAERAALLAGIIALGLR